MATSNLNPAVVPPTAVEIAAAVAAPSAATIAAAVAAPSAATIAAAIPTGATLAQHQEFSAGNWAWLGRTNFVLNTNTYTISGLSAYKKIKVHVSAQSQSGFEVLVRMNNTGDSHAAAYSVEANNYVGGQLIPSWSYFRCGDTVANQPIASFIDIESPPNGFTMVDIRSFAVSGNNFVAGFHSSTGKNVFMSTADLTSIVFLLSTDLSTSSNFGISVWGMK